jgi:F0F1-type ATP synthase membrane subunit b/b'
MLAKVSQAGELEIASATKHAMAQIRATATGLALELAAAKLSQRMSADAQGALVDRFVKHLNGPRQ